MQISDHVVPTLQKAVADSMKGTVTSRLVNLLERKMAEVRNFVV